MTRGSPDAGRSLRLRRYGESAVLAELDDIDRVQRLYDVVRAASPVGVVELVPAARTLLVGFDPARTQHRQVAAELERAGLRVAADPAVEPRRSRPDVVEVDVVYDGPDLAEVAAGCRVSVAEVVRRHTEPTYRVAFGGFAPGFAYLRGLDPTLVLPRRGDPRTSVPAGSVAVAGEWSAVYPTASPGGWHLLGRTGAIVWDVTRRPPSLFPPGALVRFRAREPA